MRHNFLLLTMSVLLFMAFTPTTNAVVHVKGEHGKTLTKKQESRLEKFKAKLKKKIERKKAKAIKKGKATGDVMDSRLFVYGLIALAVALVLALIAGILSFGFLGWLAGLIAVAGIVLMVLGILEVT